MKKASEIKKQKKDQIKFADDNKITTFAIPNETGRYQTEFDNRNKKRLKGLEFKKGEREYLNRPD